MIKNKKIRRSKTKKDDSRLYFSKLTQVAIEQWQKSTEKKEKDGIYVKEIMPAFQKLVENLINIHKFSGLHDSYDDLKNDCVNFLFETIGKFDPTRGTNAFSYFNVVAKNWLVIRTKQKFVKSKRNVSLDDGVSLTVTELRYIEEQYSLPSQEIMLDALNSAKNAFETLTTLKSEAKTENELSCINSIVTVLTNVDDIDLLNKSAVLLYIRELSGLSSKQLSAALQALKKNYKRLQEECK